MPRQTETATHFFLYFFVATESRLVKIGSTVNPRLRQAGIKSAQKEKIDLESSYMVTFSTEAAMQSAEKQLHEAFTEDWVSHPCSNSEEYFAPGTEVTAAYVLLMNRAELGWLDFIRAVDIGALQCGQRVLASFMLTDELIGVIKRLSDARRGGNQAGLVRAAFEKHLSDDSIDYAAETGGKKSGTAGNLTRITYSVERAHLQRMSELASFFQLRSRSDVARVVLGRFVSDL